MTAHTALYTVLGLAPGATTAQVRRAYRKLAKKLHPDAGGDAVKFAALAHAHDVLSDPARRARYDTLGDDAEPKREQVDPVLAGALQGIRHMVGHIFSKPGTNVATEPLIQLMRDEVVRTRGQAQQQIKQVAQLKAQAEKCLPRFKRKLAKDGEDYMSSIMRSHIEGFDQKTQQLEHTLQVLARTLVLLDDYSFDQERMMAQNAYASPYQQTDSFVFSLLGGGRQK